MEGARSEVHVCFPPQKLLTHVCTDKYAENSSSLWAESLFRQGLRFRVCFLANSAAHTGQAED